MNAAPARPVLIVQEESGLRGALLEKISEVPGLQCSAMDPTPDNSTTMNEITAFRPGLIFLDLFLPTPGGAKDLLQRILESPLEAKVIGLTTIADESAAVRAREAGAWDCLVLPHETSRAASLARLWVRLGGAEKEPTEKGR